MGRPILVTVVALLMTALALWYGFLAVQAGLALGGQLVMGSWGQLPEAARAVPVALLGLGLAGALFSQATSRGLRRGARWARFAAVLLALFAQPFGFPTDLIAAAIFALVLFFSPGVREFFGHVG